MSDKRYNLDPDAQETLAVLVEHVLAQNAAIGMHTQAIKELQSKQDEVVDGLNVVLAAISRTADADDGGLQALLQDLMAGVKRTQDNTALILNLIHEAASRP